MKKTIIKKMAWRSIDSLKPHPKQAAKFQNLSEPELRALVADIKKNGLINPIEILPDGTIVCGHQRVLAALLLGWAEIRCWLREDLAQAGDAAIEQRLIEDNLHRRQLTRLQQARLYLQRKKLAKNSPNGTDVAQDLHAYLAAQLRVDKRTLERWVRILLHTPVEVQNAFDARKLTQELAYLVAGLSADQKEAIAQAIREGKQTPSAIVRQYVQPGPKTSPNVQNTFFLLLRHLDKAEQVLRGREAEIANIEVEEREVIRRSIAMLRSVLRQTEQ